MQNIFDNFECSEFLSCHSKAGYHNPMEEWLIFSNEEAYLSEDNKLLIIGECFDEYAIKFCYRDSEPGIWALERSGNVRFWANTIGDFIEGWYKGSSRDWDRMDTVTQWGNLKKYYRDQESFYDWNCKPILNLIDNCMEHDLHNKYFIYGYKDTIELSSQSIFTSKSRYRSVEIYVDPYNLSYCNVYSEAFSDRKHHEEFEASGNEASIANAKKWLESNIITADSKEL